MLKYIVTIISLCIAISSTSAHATNGLHRSLSKVGLNLVFLQDDSDSIPERSPAPEPEEEVQAEPTISVKSLSFTRQAFICPISGHILSCKDRGILTWKGVSSSNTTAFAIMNTCCKTGDGLQVFFSNLQMHPELSLHATVSGFTLLYTIIRNCRDVRNPLLFNNMEARLEMMRGLFKAGADPNTQIFTSNDVYESLLTLACRVGNANMVRLLIDAGADMTYTDDSAMTPLHHAVTNKTCATEIVRLLLEQGADTTVKCEMNCTPLELAYYENVSVADREGVASVFKEWSDKK